MAGSSSHDAKSSTSGSKSKMGHFLHRLSHGHITSPTCPPGSTPSGPPAPRTAATQDDGDGDDQEPPYPHPYPEVNKSAAFTATARGGSLVPTLDVRGRGSGAMLSSSPHTTNPFAPLEPVPGDSPPLYDHVAAPPPSAPLGPSDAEQAAEWTQRDRRASDPSLFDTDEQEHRYLSQLSGDAPNDLEDEPIEPLPAYDQDRFVHSTPTKLLITSHGTIRSEVLVTDPNGKAMFRPEIEGQPTSLKKWIFQALPITTILKDDGGVPVLSITQGPRLMDFTARSPLTSAPIFKLRPKDFWNPGVNIRFAPHQMYNWLEVSSNGTNGLLKVRIPQENRVVATIEKEIVSMRRGVRLTVAPGESALYMTAIALAMREPCYYDTRIIGQSLSFTW